MQTSDRRSVRPSDPLTVPPSIYPSMDVHGCPWLIIHGYPQLSMGMHGDPWISMVIRCYL